MSTAQSRVTASPTPPPLFPDQTDTFDAFGRLTTRTLASTAYDFHYGASGHFDAPSATTTDGTGGSTRHHKAYRPDCCVEYSGIQH